MIDHIPSGLSIDPKSTALLLVGYQNDCFSADGILRRIVPVQDQVDLAMANTVMLLNRLAPTMMMLIATPLVLAANFRDLAETEGILGMIKNSGALREGSAGADTVAEIRKLGKRITYVHRKQGFNAFANTDLDRVLWENNVSHVIMAGMMTSLCIDSTARAAYERGYRVSILADCIVARTRDEQDFYCQSIFPLYADVIHSQRLMDQFGSGPGGTELSGALSIK